MGSYRLCSLYWRFFRFAWLFLSLAVLVLPGVSADNRAAAAESLNSTALEVRSPENSEDLKALQAQVQAVVQKTIPCTVGVRVGGAWGSGVIVRAEGYVLTAGHVSSQADRDATVFLSDGRQVKAKTLGASHGADCGLIKITEEGTWPFAPMGASSDLKPGQWCIAMGHPNGYKRGRTPVVRLGRVLSVTDRFIQTDCALVGGDSGGPLFDLKGRVIGIHSRIGNSLAANLHVPVDRYVDSWDRLAKAEVWGARLEYRGRNSGDLGFQLDSESKDCRVSEVHRGGPAEKAGFKVDDVITRFGGQKIRNSEDLASLSRRQRPGDEVSVEVMRGQETVTLKLVVGRRQRRPFGPPE
jgi:serine protease Do